MKAISLNWHYCTQNWIVLGMRSKHVNKQLTSAGVVDHYQRHDITWAKNRTYASRFDLKIPWEIREL